MLLNACIQKPKVRENAMLDLARDPHNQKLYQAIAKSRTGGIAALLLLLQPLFFLPVLKFLYYQVLIE